MRSPQIALATTGAIVRVTRSGLGCPTWPQCFPDSLAPTPHPGYAALNQWIEFGNRMLAGVVTVVALLCLLAALRTGPRRNRLTWLAAAQPVGVLVQAVLGGMTVRLGLVWWSVVVHFLPSMVIIWLAVQLVDAAGAGDGPTRAAVAAPVRRLTLVSTAVLAALLVAGTLVTAAGPHAGDAATPRLPVGVPAVAQLHADLLFGYLGLLVGLGFATAAAGGTARVWRCYRMLIVAVLAQGTLGGIQYVLGVPDVLVAFHVLGAGLVTAAAAALWAATTERPPVDPITPAPVDGRSGDGAAGLARTGA